MKTNQFEKFVELSKEEMESVNGGYGEDFADTATFFASFLGRHGKALQPYTLPF